ncbi:MHJ_0274 family protein [Mycoplasma anserisalpingitidis]|uniref:MHJ_0274 family protein n=1 Tax=Mycoplasma anserisalpingitidis TaxID=519450 RepID=UPI001CF6921F|nr:hypothetical protein [Mycoplasma anserisalpingitidis]UCU26658.1 hypothetical protein K7D06_03625 [Mycoplasma anserisalpingitidis]UCU27496.1 hypothetical protein K9O38_00415 [Mycoplasma anserisalpingitidis]
MQLIKSFDTTSSKGGLADVFNTPVSWIIFAVVGVIFIGWISYSYIKGQIDKKKLKKQALELEIKSKEEYNESLAKIYYIIKTNEKYLSEFTVSIGKYNMGTLTNTTQSIITDLLSEQYFKDLILFNVDYKKYVNHIITLKDNKSNNWTKKCNDSIIEIEKLFEQNKDSYDQDKLNDFEERVLKYYENKLFN